MARIWSEPYDSLRHRQGLMPEGFGGSAARVRHGRTPTLVGHRVIFVRVCSFTFEFHSIEEIRACAAYYSSKLQPSSQCPAAARAVHDGAVAWRWEVERWYERLPLYLREEQKRVQVVSALEHALRKAEAGEV